MHKWGILCPGPSLALYQIQKAISLANHDALVAVNGAILLTDFHIDFWITQDIEVFEEVARRIDLSRFYSTRLWVPRRWETAIPADYNYLNRHYQTFFKDTFPAQSSPAFQAFINNSLHFQVHSNINWHDYTILPAIALSIKEGAKDIRIYGADMRGEGYFIKGIENYRTIHNAERWKQEAYHLQELIKICAGHNIQITREVTT